VSPRQTAGRRHPGDDQTYARAHVEEVIRQFPRIGHHIDALDRDLTEYCHFCKEPLELDELVRDVGQPLGSKPVTLTRRVAQRAVIPAKLIAWRVARPPEVDAFIDKLNEQVRSLEARYPITQITVRDLVNGTGQRVSAKWHSMAPEEWWLNRLALHRSHHAVCAAAARSTYPVNMKELAELAAYRRGSGLYVPDGTAQLLFLSTDSGRDV
jgi:hypothetical protein